MQPKPPRILVADSDPAGRTGLRRQLEHAGYDVSYPEYGSDVIRYCHDAPPDVLILDVDLPDMDGFEVCEYLRHTTGGSETTVIFLSAANDDMTRTYLGRMVDYADGDFFFAKPYDARLVARVVQELVGDEADAPQRSGNLFPTRVIWPTAHCRVLRREKTILAIPRSGSRFQGRRGDIGVPRGGGTTGIATGTQPKSFTAGG